jgi:hypothetical protein
MDHPMAHALGREAFERAGDAPAVLVECPYGLASGCFHGTLEAYLASRSTELTGQDIRDLCQRVANERGSFGHFQCLHGLGHGVMIFSDHEIQPALDLCDELGDWWSRESCYGGVFMENIVSYQVWSGLGIGEGVLHNHGDAEGELHHGWIYAHDPQYPCNVVDEKYKGACYTLQTTAFLTLNYYQVSRGFALCDQAEPDWIYMCYLSMGRDISSMVARNGAWARDQCLAGNPSWVSWCIVGVVKDFINSAGTIEPGLAFCDIVSSEHKPPCYRAMGEMLLTLAPTKAARWEACGAAPGEYATDCRAGAAI